MSDIRPVETLTDRHGDVHELGDNDVDGARTIYSLLPQLPAKLRGAQKSPTKTQISLRVSQDTLSKFRATGAGWQTRMDQALREWIDHAEFGAR